MNKEIFIGKHIKKQKYSYRPKEAVDCCAICSADRTPSLPRFFELMISTGSPGFTAGS